MDKNRKRAPFSKEDEMRPLAEKLQGIAWCLESLKAELQLYGERQIADVIEYAQTKLECKLTTARDKPPAKH